MIKYISTMSIFFLIILSFLFSDTLVSAEWISVPNGKESEIRAVYFADNSNGWIIGVKGLIKHTYNGGGSWTTQNSGVSNDLNDLYFANSTTGWIVGDNGTILYTNNAGITWVPIHIQTNHSLRGVYFVNSNQGWIVGDFGTILYTADSGKNWIEQYSGTSVTLEDLHFADSKNGWAIGINGTALYTNNGGNLWEPQLSDSSDFLYDVYFCDGKNGWVVGDNGTILHTSDGGVTWEKQATNKSQRLRGVYFVDTNQGWIVGDSATILHTMNSGKTWIAEPKPNDVNTEVRFYDVSHGGTNLWIVGTQGKILQNSNALAVQTINIREDVDTEFVLPHEPKIGTGQLSIDSKPRDAKIYLNGALIESKTPTTIKNLIPGRYEIKVSRSNYGIAKKRVYISENETTSVSLQMPSRSRQIGLFTAIVLIGGITVGVLTSL